MVNFNVATSANMTINIGRLDMKFGDQISKFGNHLGDQKKMSYFNPCLYIEYLCASDKN